MATQWSDANFKGWVTACIPHYQCQRYIGRSVESLLKQTYPWIRIVVVNDGDPTPPWRELSRFDDPRLVTFEIPNQMGPYFSLEVARRATPDAYFLIQDADDWSASNRVEILLATLDEEGTDYAFSAQPQFTEDAEGGVTVTGVRWDSIRDGEWGRVFSLNRTITQEFLYRAPHHGLFRTAALGRVGGYYGGYRITWDTMLTNLILMTGSISWTAHELYHRLVRPESLSHSKETGVDSEYHRAVHARIGEIYAAVFDQYERLRAGEISDATFERRLRRRCASGIPSGERRTLSREARRLRSRFAEMAI